MKQKTLKNEIKFEGIGVHSGQHSIVILRPMPEDSGIVFINPNFVNTKIEIGKIVPEEAMHASVIKSENVAISTLEHLMAAISAMQIDNLSIEVNGFEIPILDGSSLSFVYEIERVGLFKQSSQKQFLTPIEPLIIENKDGKYIKILPAELKKGLNEYDNNLYFEYFADFNHPLIGRSELDGVFSPQFFKEHIAPARTFGFLEQLPFLRKHGLAKGTSLGNTVVVGEEELLNEPRFDDEFVRHKLLDLFGDLALLGKNLAGKVIAKKTGHNFNRQVIAHYIKNPKEWRLI